MIGCKDLFQIPKVFEPGFDPEATGFKYPSQPFEMFNLSKQFIWALKSLG